jgi:hypothetical protein
MNDNTNTETTMQLTQTNGGNWAKRATVGSRWTSHGVYMTREAADHAAARRNGACVREIEAGEKLVVRLGVKLGETCYMVATPAGGRQVMQHASAAECLAHGKTPGKCNL